MTLNELTPGQSAKVLSVGGAGALRQHFLDMGITPGTIVTLVKYAPMGDPCELSLRGYSLTLRLSDLGLITGERTVLPEADAAAFGPRKKAPHPKLGEERRQIDTTPLPEGTPLYFALIGNQNSGKTTLFNRLTGSHQHVGNFPGVTVDKKSGPIKGHPDTEITDLPGIYSMSPYSSEEIVTRNFVLTEPVSAIINIVDATNMERNLYLTLQLLELELPMVVALNMMDELTANGGSVDVNRLEDLLGVPVVPISAAKDEGIEELVSHALFVARHKERPLFSPVSREEEGNQALFRCHQGISHLIEDHALSARLPLSFAAGKLIEGDALIKEQLSLDENESETVEKILLQMEKEGGADRSAAMADLRFSRIERICKKALVRPKSSHEKERSDKIDRILTGRFTAIPAFFLVMVLIFFITFHLLGPLLQDLLSSGIGALSVLASSAMEKNQVNPAIRELVTGGIFEGVGSVLSFMPIILLMFLFLSLLEDSGYIARVAFVMDKLLRKLGLSGRSIVPLLIGFGCTVPAVMSTRTLPSERDRKMTILLTPFMSCSAKLPIYAFLSAAFFPKISGLIMVLLYFGGILLAVFVSLIFKKTLFSGEPVPFVMELPHYRLPSPKNVLILLWEKARDFLSRAFSVILIASIVIWFLKSFDFHINLVSDPEKSMLSTCASLLTPLMAPCGLGDWRICVSLISGFLAKESVVSTMQVLFNDLHAISQQSAAALLVFSLLYTPCVAAVASIRREMGRKWALFVVLWQCLLAWACACLLYWCLMLII